MRMIYLLPFLMMFRALPGLALDGDLEEAAGLEPRNMQDEDPPIPSGQSWLRWRGYGLIDYGFLKVPQQDSYQEIGPEGELALSIDITATPTLNFFLEQRTIVAKDGGTADSVHGLWEQGGVRYRPLDSLLLVVGKERNRRSPGLIVSPSDFIHTNQNLPGLREERSGVWLARAAWQGKDQSFDLMALPVTVENSQGMIADESEYKGTVARYFGRLGSGWDLGVDYGQFREHGRAGFFLQTLIADVWKVYAEAGFDSQTEAYSTLIGGSFEGSSDWTLRAEWYQQDENWVPTLALLQQSDYLILSLSLIELWDRFNLTPTILQSLGRHHHQAGIFRGEWLLDQRQVIGLTFLSMNPERPFAWQASLDWKINF
jgi:hypothetical protein